MASESGFEFIQSEGTRLPLVVSVPHDGHRVPSVAGVVPRQRGHVVRDQLVSYVASDLLQVCPGRAVIGRVHRKYIDYNRAALEESPLVGHGYEDDRLAPLYFAYHRALRQAISLVRAEHPTKTVLLLDLHGFSRQPSYAPPGGYDLIFGTVNRASVGATDFDIRFGTLLARMGYQVFIPGETPIGDKPDEYDAGYITRAYASASVCAIQIEIARRFRERDSTTLGKALAQDLGHALRSVLNG